jgi:hypothetical protein
MSDIVATPDTFIASVLAMPDGDKKVELLDKLITMRNAEIERQAKRDFDSHFAELRSKLVPVQRSKENKFLGTKYASLDAEQKLYDPIISDHGFSYTWREDPAEGGIIVFMDVSGYGHTRTNSKFIPNPGEMKGINAIQVSGSMSSYGKRYTFEEGFGIVKEDEDTDGDFRTVKINEELQAELNAIAEAPNLDALMNAYEATYDRYKGDADKRRVIIGVYIEAKQKIVKGA